MGIKNTLKILSSNFSLTWKSGLYKLICFALVIFLGYQLVAPIFESIQSQDLLGEVFAFFEGLLSFRGQQMATASQNIADIINSIMMDSYVFSIILLFILVFALLPFLLGLSDMSESDVLYGAMSCNTKFKYLAIFMSNLKSAIKVSSFKLIFTVPYSLIVFLLCFAISKMFVFGGIVTYLGIFLVILVVLLAITLERTILGFFQASSIVHNPKLKCILERGLINTLRQFGKNFSYNFVLIVCVFFINTFVGLYTFGVGLIVTLPASLLSFNVLSMVLYFNAYGLNYYVTPSEVVYSKKLDEQIDIKDMKYIL